MDDRSGFISMYVEIDSKSLTPPNEISVVELRFFVYNKKKNKYFTIQDVEVKRFNALKTVWGWGRVLLYDTFNNHGNGYIFEGDQCEFGVNVIVSPPPTRMEILSFHDKIPYPKYLWTVKKFSELIEYVHISNSFSMGAMEWFLKLYPKGFSRADGKWLSVFLHLADSHAPKADEKIFMQGHCTTGDWHIESNNGWGWDQFLSLDKLRKVYLDKEDALNIEIEFQVVSATKYFPII
uniref:MATH domain-containing protein n=1 Tax=Brassica oleracea var. oleracea TaxID=109376 RepID=A0A0D3CXM5_BRAOL